MRINRDGWALPLAQSPERAIEVERENEDLCLGAGLCRTGHHL
jgi:hypothetical protein